MTRANTSNAQSTVGNQVDDLHLEVEQSLWQPCAVLSPPAPSVPLQPGAASLLCNKPNDIEAAARNETLSHKFYTP